MDEENQEPTEDDEAVEVSRRKFLKWAAYVPPAVVTAMTMATPTAAQTETCNPDLCPPDDDSGGCNPPSDCPPNNRDQCNPPAK